MSLSNWAGNVTFSADRVSRPRTVDELADQIGSAAAAGARIHAIGSRHSFSRVADAPDVLVDLVDLDAPVEFVGEHVWVGASVRYGELVPVLDGAGRALHNLPSLPHVTVAGAVATATHGSGDTNAGLAAAVDAVELVLADGTVRTIERGAADFGGAVVSLGALGVVTRLRLRTEPTFDVEQTVYRGLPIETAVDHLDEIMALAYSVSLFTDWHSGVVDQVWVKRRVDTDPAVPTDVFGAGQSTTTVHPLAAMSAEACTTQLGVRGPWHARLPHFRLEFTPSGGEELQSEFFVERRHAPAAVRAVAEIGRALAPQLLVSEVRSVAADDQWMSTTSGADHLALHFTWRLDPVGVAQVLPTLEAALDPFDARPHWGKVTTTAPATVRDRFPSLPRFVELADRLDPGHAFRTPYLTDLIGG